MDNLAENTAPQPGAPPMPPTTPRASEPRSPERYVVTGTRWHGRHAKNAHKHVEIIGDKFLDAESQWRVKVHHDGKGKNAGQHRSTLVASIISDFAIDAESRAKVDAGELGAPQPTVAPIAPQAPTPPTGSHYVLAIGARCSGSTVPGHEGTFEVESVAFGANGELYTLKPVGLLSHNVTKIVGITVEQAVGEFTTILPAPAMADRLPIVGVAVAWTVDSAARAVADHLRSLGKPSDAMWVLSIAPRLADLAALAKSIDQSLGDLVASTIPDQRLARALWPNCGDLEEVDPLDALVSRVLADIRAAGGDAVADTLAAQWADVAVENATAFHTLLRAIPDAGGTVRALSSKTRDIFAAMLKAEQGPGASTPPTETEVIEKARAVAAVTVDAEHAALLDKLPADVRDYLVQLTELRNVRLAMEDLSTDTWRTLCYIVRCAAEEADLDKHEAGALPGDD